ncbi:unnamed protein product [Linum tenue]|uniref:Uncharacterized protein n=3 Tax=Linum tenue TaxID=586396 RepID=A0AAV0J9X2_9ROSI|nr:unnamed protein product [Linum tenue]
MVAVFNKDLLSWYLITLKLRETVESASAATAAADSHSPAAPLLLEYPQQPPPPPPDQSKPPSPDSDWVISIKDKLTQARIDDASASWERFCIYRVPHYLREEDDKAYAPQLVSLGPYHHAKKRLRKMERHKWRCLHRVLTRTDHDIRLYLDSVRELEDRARSSYEGGSAAISMGSNEFVEMLVLDGCFVIELLRGAAEGFRDLGYSRNDPVFAMRGSMHSIQRDMIMLENQIPLFVLDRLMGLQLNEPDQTGIVARLAIRFFDPLMPTDEPLSKSDRTRLESSLRTLSSFDPLSDLGGLHCLDVFRRSLLRSGPKPVQRVWIRKRSHSERVVDKRRQQLIHCAIELKDAGIKFKRRRTDRFWDIRFKNGVLKMPRILIHDGTKSLFLNLIAFEQCHLDCSNDITSYVIFMDNLINSPEDVAYLHYCGIVEHWLGSDAEVADLFNRLCQEVVFDVNNSYLARMSEEVNQYYNHRWNAWRASLKHKYFGNPWAIISLFAAVVLLVLTFTQTFYGVYGYYRPRT